MILITIIFFKTVSNLSTPPSTESPSELKASVALATLAALSGEVPPPAPVRCCLYLLTVFRRKNSVEAMNNSPDMMTDGHGGRVASNSFVKAKAAWSDKIST